MRIAITRPFNAVFGGVERYLQRLIPAMQALGLEVILVCEGNGGDSDSPILCADEGEVWCGAELGTEAVRRNLRSWRPDLIFSHGLDDAHFEADVFSLAPTVFFAHEYYGTCISRAKTFGLPHHSVCQREFGIGCVANFFPRRCGGLNPLTMIGDYTTQAAHLRNLRKVRTILTASEHMRSEYLRHRFAPAMLHKVLLPIELPPLDPAGYVSRCARLGDIRGSINLLFLGRMIFAKGGQVLLDALPIVASALKRTVCLSMTGDGPDRGRWEREAARITARHTTVGVRFTGWREGRALEESFLDAHLLVLPSIWPEPFGLVGVEASGRGLPAAAFDVGGISEWLHDGINGHLAPAGRMSAENLAHAIVKCLDHPEHYATLCSAGPEIAARFNMPQHLSQLLSFLDPDFPVRAQAPVQEALSH